LDELIADERHACTDSRVRTGCFGGLYWSVFAQAGPATFKAIWRGLGDRASCPQVIAAH